MPIRMEPAVAGLALALAFPAMGLAEDVPPTENVGVSAEGLGELDLTDQFDVSSGRHFRVRVIKVAPGGVIALHKHNNRPSVEYVQSGTAIEVRGEEQRQMEPGDVMIADVATEHWWRNTGDGGLELLAGRQLPTAAMSRSARRNPGCGGPAARPAGYCVAARERLHGPAV